MEKATKVSWVAREPTTRVSDHLHNAFPGLCSNKTIVSTILVQLIKFYVRGAKKVQILVYLFGVRCSYQSNYAD